MPAIWGRVRARVIDSVPNLILRRYSALEPVPSETLTKVSCLTREQIDLGPQEHMKFLERYFPNWEKFFSDPFYKKLLELHSSWRLLEIRPEDTYLDLAGGLYTYTGFLDSRRKLLNDRYVTPSLREEMKKQGVEIVESPAQCMPLDDCTVDKISCHHSFEHFRDDGDTRAIREIQRVLRPGGKACIIPLFLAIKHFEIVDSPWTSKSDLGATRVVDPTSPFPGGVFSGGFARVYDVESLQSRVLKAIDFSRFRVSVVDILSKGKPVPDPSLPCHRTDPIIDFPHRALLIERHSS